MEKHSLTLFFPQWQGSGSLQAPSLQEGATQIARLLKTEPVNINLAPPEQLETQANIKGRSQLLQQLKTVSTLLAQKKPEHLFTIGGDCGVDLAPASYLNAQSNLALLWLDAHGDLNTPASSPSGAFHGMVLRTLLGEGDPDFLRAAFSTFTPEQVFLAGARDFDPPERAFAEGLEHMPVDDLERQPMRLVERISAKGFTKLHIHLDLDVLEPAEFASTGYPTQGGLSVKGLVKLLEVLQERFELVGLTLTEFTPQETSFEDNLDKVRNILNGIALSR